jgi:hypothetical protein
MKIPLSANILVKTILYFPFLLMITRTPSGLASGYLRVFCLAGVGLWAEFKATKGERTRVGKGIR